MDGGAMKAMKAVTRPALRYHVDETTGCHVFTGAKNEHGYGVVGTNGRGTFKAHRVAFERAGGSIPDGLHLDHLCRNRACINPDHLEPVTNAENARRGAKAKLTQARADEIRQRYAAGGCSYRSLAAEYGVSDCAISNIMNRRRWA